MMLEDFLSDIYDRAMTVELLKEASFYSCFRHIDYSRKKWNEASEYLGKIINDLRKTDVKKGTELANGSIKAQENYNNWHNFSAMIDMDVVPKVLDYLKQFIGVNVKEGEWTLESSNTGFLTLRNERYGYVHSPFDPMWESFIYANSIFDPEVNCYYILGGGLGYLPYQLWKMSEGEADIYVFEIDETISGYADLYGVISMIDDDKIHVITGDDTDIILEKFTEDIPDKTILRTVYHWDASNYKGVYAEYFNILLASEVTSRIFGNKWKSNFDWNAKLEHKLFSEIDSSYKDEWVVVGAGPSLNDCEEFIRESVCERTICAVNSSLKWFYLHGIKPDLCTVCDPTDMLVPHIEGIESFSKDIPIVADCIANRKYMELYEGKKYYIYSSAAAMTVGINNVKGDVWGIGGTVTSMALETAFKLGAKKVYLIGADLSYPDRVMFADGVGHEVTKWMSNEVTTVSVDDRFVPTSMQFNQYRTMIESQIEDHPGVEVINKSLHGAYIKGTFCGRWWENLPNSTLWDAYKPLLDELKKDTNLLDWNKKYYIFWQIIGKMESNSSRLISDNQLMITNTYKCIYDSFKEEMNCRPYNRGETNKKLTYLFTDEFTGDKSPESLSILKVAKAEILKKRNVLIINTAEKMGGEKVPVHDCISSQYNSVIENSEEVTYENYSFPFFQLPIGMPELHFYKTFLESVAETKPNKVIKMSRYSLLADYYTELSGIETVVNLD